MVSRGTLVTVVLEGVLGVVVENDSGPQIDWQQGSELSTKAAQQEGMGRGVAIRVLSGGWGRKRPWHSDAVGAIGSRWR